MKKIFTLVCGLLGLVSAVNAETVDDLKLCKHSYVFVADDATSNGLVKPAKGSLVGDGFVLLCGSDANKTVATNKGSVDLSTADELGIVTPEIVAKYGEYGTHLNSLRLKTTQDVVAMKVTAGSKLIIFFEKNKESDVRYPVIAEDEKLNSKISTESDVVIKGAYGGKQVGRMEWTSNDDRTIYIGAENQIHISYLIVEANEAPGTPSVKVGDQQFENGLWFREVTCKANDFTMEGSTEKIPTVVTYTTDGSTPTATSPVYTEPIKCYQDMTVKFQAYQDWGMGVDEGFICPNADNEGIVSFNFDAPTIAVDGASFTITSPYAQQNGANFYKLNDGEEQAGDGATLSESATVTAYTKITNGTYGVFTSKTSAADVFVLNPIKANKEITVTGTAVVDEEATNAATDGSTVYTTTDAVLNGVEKMDFFVKKVEFGVLANADAAKAPYQAPAGQEAYIKMTDNTSISFLVADGDSVNVTVTCSKNSCKNIDETDEDVNAQDSKVADNRKCFINVDGTNYGGEDLKLNPEGNVVKFGLQGGLHTFQKYSGTGNIFVSSIKIEYIGTAGIREISAEKKFNAKKVIKNGQFVIETVKGNYNAAGIRVK